MYMYMYIYIYIYIYIHTHIYIYKYMVSGTLNNSNFYSFKSYWIFGILGILTTKVLVLKSRSEAKGS